MRIDRVALVAEMARRNLTSKALSEKSGVSRGTISNIKNGKSCSVIVGDAIARALNVDVLDIIEQEESS